MVAKAKEWEREREWEVEFEVMMMEEEEGLLKAVELCGDNAQVLQKRERHK